jgi:hypothetical protein
MQKFKVDGGTFRCGAGEVVGLTKAQAASRINRLETVGEDLYRAREGLDFKNGEIIRLDPAAIPKAMRDIIVNLDAVPAAEPAKKKTMKAEG